MTVYPHERQIEYWVSHAIEDYFQNEGYDVVVLPNSNRTEKVLPYDHLFVGKGIKVFGLQYKRLHNGTQDYWSIDAAQFGQVKKFNWIYYALPQINSIRQHRNALHLLVIVTSNSLKSSIPSLKSSIPSTGEYRFHLSDLGIGRGKLPYFRWGGFMQKLKSCTEGWKPSSADELRSIFREAGDLLSTLIDLYIVALTTKLVVRISPFVTDTHEIESGFDFGIVDTDNR